VKLEEAEPIAQRIRAMLTPACERVAIAGSIRRRKPEVHDIEIVCSSKVYERPVRDMYDQDTGHTAWFDHLEELVSLWLDNTPEARAIKNGDRYKQIALPEGINLDLFIVRPPAQWGVILAIRTGPADYSHWLVTPYYSHGALPPHMRVHDGALWKGETLIPTPEEADFFRHIERPMPETWERVTPPGWR
jgi:DNA polymerase/3'-5' exonuclease PolX